MKKSDSDASASGSDSIQNQGWMQASGKGSDAATVSVDQLTSLNALIAYVAHWSGTAEFRVERNLSDRFNVPNAKCLPEKAYDPAIRYLVDSITC